MIISENWLRRLVSFRQDFTKLPALLTRAGIEAGPVESLSGLSRGVIVARVEDVIPHPNASGLSICTVATGKKKPVKVVCGAANVRPGMMTAYAGPKSELPGGVRIEAKTIRGHASEGMLCSEAELGLEEQSHGLIEWDQTLSVGISVNTALDLPDQVFEVELTPNRGDCLSMLGIARETAAVTGGALVKQTVKTTSARVDNSREVELDAPQGCPRYVGRVIRGVQKDQKSPDWMCERLRRAGLRSVDALVDITNYVMLELGQPMHAFDNDRLNGAIEVRMAAPKERLTLLDGQKLILDDASLVITDASGPVALAGIKGGAGSMISEKTESIFLEAAFFDPQTIARTARAFSLNTDASHRFERGVDFNLPLKAMARATQLVLELCGGTAGPVIDATEKAHLPKRGAITLRRDRLTRMLGTALPKKKVDAVFAQAGYAFTPSTSGWKVRPPTHRFDLVAEHDLVEEVARLSGYDTFPANRPRVLAGERLAPEADVELNRARDLLVDRGFFEAITYSFIGADLQRTASGGKGGIALKNPIASQLAEMRLALLPGLLLALGNNLRRQVRDVRLFESGHVFWGTARKPLESLSIGGVVTGSATGTRWDQKGRDVDFFDIKGDVESLIDLAGASGRTQFAATVHPSYQAGQCAEIFVDGASKGFVGRVSREMLRVVDIDRPVFAFELDWESVSRRRVPQHLPVSRFPQVSRDLSFEFDEAIDAARVMDCIRQGAGDLLQNAEVIDSYKENDAKSTRKSMTFRLTLQSEYRNLTDGEVDAVANHVVDAVGSELAGTLRGR